MFAVTISDTRLAFSPAGDRLDWGDVCLRSLVDEAIGAGQAIVFENDTQVLGLIAKSNRHFLVNKLGVSQNSLEQALLRFLLISDSDYFAVTTTTKIVSGLDVTDRLLSKHAEKE